MSTSLEPTVTSAGTALDRPTKVDAERWPDVAVVPSKALRASIARRLFGRGVAQLPIRVLFADGTSLGAGGADDPVMRVLRPEAMYQRIGAGGLIGFGEAFMAGDWESDDLVGVLTAFASRVADIIPPKLQRLRDLAVTRRPGSERNTQRNARRNIAAHYDLSNDLFELFLDSSLTYSSALFGLDDFGMAMADHEVFTEAQHRKIDRLLDQAKVTAGSEVLEIGTGWGELSIRAAMRGAKVTSITLSAEQQALARARVEAAGLSDLVTIELRDYREQTGLFDAVVSVEMIEAVGYTYWPVYFASLDRLLKPGGRVGLQAITMPNDRMVASRNTYTWVHKYIFPGGIIPSTESIEANVANDTNLTVVDAFPMGPHYAETLRLWRETFDSVPDEVHALGFDHVFQLMWRFYLAYSEAGFRCGYLNVFQYTLAKAGA